MAIFFAVGFNPLVLEIVEKNNFLKTAEEKSPKKKIR
ncbi:hypothetical protein SGRA_4161 [Saprospira grandis str. Lewin]|uniref:Uncharacterized protein n=1 Tax=Saprospira grandis (strain Lewin) TaxID=984262 RepID=H6L8S0_SAPGL|nr:hypothetical protein SGRA_4161 [Saprospira grandis str. Lewin]